MITKKLVLENVVKHVITKHSRVFLSENVYFCTCVRVSMKDTSSVIGICPFQRVILEKRKQLFVI